jgi:SpoVK/Ycf46/Vps4 family AAA+-type ATPase
LPKQDLARPIAHLSHFEASVSKLRPSVDKSFLSRYEKWTRELGESGI